MKLEKIISELLQSHECVLVPDLGGFVAQYKSAHIHPITHMISPPSLQIGFNKHLTQFDGLLSSEVSRQWNITLMEANFEVAQWVKTIQTHLAQGHRAMLPQLGVLWLDQQGQMQFIPAEDVKSSLQHFGLSPIHLHVIHSKDSAITSKTSPVRGKQLELKKWIAVGAAAITIGIGFFAYSTQHPHMDFAGMGNWGNQNVTTAFVPHATRLDQLETNIPVSTETELQKLWNATSLTGESPIHKTISPESIRTESVWGKSWVVGGVFKDKINAEKQLQQMKSQGFKNALIIPFQDYFYACYGTASSEKDEAILRAQVQRVDPRAWTKR